jgi:benzylsuccinate CoA-transferase BbsF subunit
MARLGLGYDDLRKIKPDIIMLSTCMYGQTGPFAALPGFGLTLTGAAGISHLAGWPDRPPLPSGAYTDFVVPKFNVLALLAALDYRRRTGKGQYLDVSQLEAALHFQIPVLLEYTAYGRELGRIGNRSAFTAPQGVYRCKGENSWCAISIESDEEWKSFCTAVDKQEWIEDPRFATRMARLANLEPLDILIEEWTQGRDPEEIMGVLQNAGVAAGVAQNGEQLDKDPQLKHRQYYRELDHSEMGKVSYSGFSMKMSETPFEIKRGAPRLGEHTEYVCSEILQMTNEEFVHLMNEGVFE